MPSRIRDRKLVQWVIAYAAVAWLVVQGLEVATEAFPPLNIVLRTALVLALMGLPMAVVIGWFHGEKGRQRVSVIEVSALAVIVATTGVLVFRFDVYGTDDPPLVTARAVSELDTTRFAVLPFRRTPGVPDSSYEELLLHDALSRWDGIETVEHLRLLDEAASDGGRPDPRRLAADFGAGRYVTGSVAMLGSSTRVHVRLFDTGLGEQLTEATAELPPGKTLTTGAAKNLAESLLFGSGDGAGPEEAEPVTDSYPARRDFLAALAALHGWHLEAADSLLGAALDADPDHPRALLWQAQVRNWGGVPPSALAGPVEAAWAARDRLEPTERLQAVGLWSLARGEFRQACAAYDSLRQEDGRSFPAWFGLGECRSRDEYVVPDPASPSGWSFRSSYHQAAQAYRRAFELLPLVYHGISSRTFEQVGALLRASSDARWGRALPPDSMTFLARPALIDDSLAFIPYPAQDVYEGRPETRPATTSTAVERQRRLYNEIAEYWVAALPGDSEALQALAYTRALVADPRALETLEEARASTDNPARRLKMTAQRVRLLIKFGSARRLAEARTLADSVLDDAEPTTREEARLLSVVAALAGRSHQAARWAAQGAEPWPWPVTVPVAATSPAAVLETYAAMGGPLDSIAAYERALTVVLETRIPDPEREPVRIGLLMRAASLAYMDQPLECFERLAGQSPYPLLHAQAAHADGDLTRAIRILSEIRDRRLGMNIRDTGVSYDALLPEAWLWAELGDTATAVVMLDASLNTRRWAEPGSLVDVPRAASLVRAMALRAELAAATGDEAIARRWATAVRTLWGDADPVLASLSKRMGRILEAPYSRRGDAP